VERTTVADVRRALEVAEEGLAHVVESHCLVILEGVDRRILPVPTP
jgi:hypothetical protein